MSFMALPDNEKEHLKKHFEAMAGDVELLIFTQEFECAFCKETRELMLELGALSPKIKTKVHDFIKDSEACVKYNIKKIPAIAIVGKSDYGIRFYGIPAGYELPMLVESIIDVSRGTTSLPDDIKRRLAEIKRPVHIQVFVSPTCPFCPKASRIAYRFAIESEFIKSDVIEMTEFPYLVQKYGVMSIPHVVINEDISFVGAQPPEVFIEQITLALSRGYNMMYT